MLSKKAAQLAGLLANRGIISPEDIDVYAYGLELLLSTALNVLLVIILSILFSEPMAWLFFLLPFIPLRLASGGYHAKSHLACGLMFTVGYTALMLAGILTAGLVTPLILICVSAGCLVVVLLLAPVQSSNKPLDEQEKRRNRRRSLVLSIVCLMVASASLFVGPGLMMMITFFVLGQLGAAILLLVAKIAGD